MKITFLVDYFYRPLPDKKDKTFRAGVSVRLPKLRGESCIPIYYCGKIGDCEIDIDAGIETVDSRSFFIKFHAESLEELDRKIDYAIEQYRQQVLQNIEILEKIGEGREITIDLPEPPYE